MGMQTVARVAESFDGTFECRHCEYEVGATVFAKSSGTARGIDEAAQRTAFENAETDANALAARTLQFVPCPKCGKTDPTGHSYRVQVTIGSLVLGALGAGAIWLYMGLRTRGRADATMAEWGAIGFGVFLAALLYWKWGRPWRSAAKRTVFHRAQ